MARLDFDPSKLKKVSIDEVHVNTWNPKDTDTDEYKEVLKSVKQKGLRGFIAVREDKEGGYEIIDGQQRYTAASELEYEEVVIYNEGDVSDQEARELTIWYQQQVPFNKISEAYLVTEMLDEYGMDTLELPYNDAQYEEFKKLAEFNMDDYKKTEDEPDNEDIKTIKVVVSDDQYAIIRKAMDSVVVHDNCSEGQALERICADFLGGDDGALAETSNETE